ncbi:MAG TPA: hypothetical protein VGW30_04025, partial [Gaiellaceae bacterium]|nr:hypothetical protein [Gaiellaceae bacterium]
PLHCELHAHTTWSDGTQTQTELVDLYGRHGFDVLCVTDHVLPTGAPDLTESAYPRYLAAIDREARRAREQYDLLLVPGLELTFHDGDADGAGHALALGVRSWIPLDGGLENALLEARTQGAAIVAAHPHGSEADPNLSRTTRWFWRNRDRAAGLVDRWELINRGQTFGWIAEFGLPAVATGDFHRLEHLDTWKTLLPCAKTEQAVVAYLRSQLTAYIVPWHLRDEPRRRLAA